MDKAKEVRYNIIYISSIRNPSYYNTFKILEDSKEYIPMQNRQSIKLDKNNDSKIIKILDEY